MSSTARDPTPDPSELLVAYVAGGSSAPDVQSLDHRTLVDVLELADENGVFHEFVTGLNESDSLPAEYQSEWENERSRIRTLRRTIKTLNDASSERDVEYILIKDCNTVPHVPRDVDIYVRNSDKRRMIDALRQRGMTVDHAGSIETSLVGDHHLPVDIYTDLVYFGHEFLSAPALFAAVEQRTIFGTTYPGLDDETEFLLTLVHAVFGHRRLTLLDFIHLERLHRSNVARDRCRGVAERHGWAGTFEWFLALFEELRDAVYGSGRSVTFPVLLSRTDVLNCALSIESEEFDPRERMAISVSLIIDGAKFRLENSPLSEPIRRCTPLKRALLWVGYLSRRLRGDEYS